MRLKDHFKKIIASQSSPCAAMRLATSLQRQGAGSIPGLAQWAKASNVATAAV